MDGVIIFYTAVVLAKIYDIQKAYMNANPTEDLKMFTKKFITKIIDALNDVLRNLEGE